MKTKLLICGYILTMVSFGVCKTYGCCEEPEAWFEASPYYVCVDQVVNFDASDSCDPDGCQIVQYIWSFGSGAYDISGEDGPIPTCKYNSVGPKTVTLTVWDNDSVCCGGSDKSDTWELVVTVVKVDLDSVTFGGTEKHRLCKKDPNQWDPSNENYASNYGIFVPDRAWVKNPPLSDPLCYTRSSSGSDSTTKILLTIYPSLYPPVSVTVKGKEGGNTVFTRDVSLEGTWTETGWMPLANALSSAVDWKMWQISWYINVDGVHDRFLGVCPSNNCTVIKGMVE